jgi:hypothetical protein
MIVVDLLLYRGLCQIRKISLSADVWGGVPGVVAGVVDDGGDGAGGGVGDGDVDGDLVHVLFVEGLEVEGFV